MDHAGRARGAAGARCGAVLSGARAGCSRRGRTDDAPTARAVTDQGMRPAGLTALSIDWPLPRAALLHYDRAGVKDRSRSTDSVRARVRGGRTACAAQVPYVRTYVRTWGLFLLVCLTDDAWCGACR